MNSLSNSIVGCLSRHAAETPQATAFVVLNETGDEEKKISYAELMSGVHALVSVLEEKQLENKRVLLVYQDVCDFLVAFLACDQLGIIAVPVPYMRGSKQVARLVAIIEDAQVSAILCKACDIPLLQQGLGGYLQQPAPEIIPADLTDRVAFSLLKERTPANNRISFIQYTSGSTGNPKGVVVTEDNLMHNQEMIKNTFGCNSQSVIFTWLPFHHDMGLIGNLLHTIYTGCTCIVMSPYHFMQSPLRWLQGISKYKVTHSGGPNFAYDLCVDKITPEQLSKLDLRSWKVAYNGSEPVRFETLQRFAAHFRTAGFNEQAFYPCYGLAEATLLVSGRKKAAVPLSIYIDRNLITNNKVVLTDNRNSRAQCLVSSGIPAQQMNVKIVSLTGEHECNELEEGEVCISGKCVTAGYWNKDNSDNFYVFDDQQFFRTGDIGFTCKEELFIHGRLREMLIIRGANLYPADIEKMVAAVNPAIENSGVAVFSTYVQEDQLVIIAEIKRTLLREIDAPALISSIDKTINGYFGIDPYDIVLVIPGSIPRTTSGKLQRLKCRDNYLQNELHRVASKQLLINKLPAKQKNDLLLKRVIEQTDGANIKNYLIDLIELKVGPLPVALITGNAELTEMGIDSVRAMELINIINSDLHISIDISQLFRDNTLSGFISIVENRLGLKNAATWGPGNGAAIPVVENKQHYPLSGAQERIWILSQFEQGAAAYTIVRSFYLQGTIDKENLEKAFQATVQRHHSLRTVFYEIEGTPVQKVQAHISFNIEFEDVSRSGIIKTYLQTCVAGFGNTKFDLAKGPLLRVKLLQLSPDEYAMVLAIHHIISDGWSIKILMQEVIGVYEALCKKEQYHLEPLNIQYKDYSDWANRSLNSDKSRDARNFWVSEFAAISEPFNLPADHLRPSVRSYEGALCRYYPPDDLYDQLVAFCKSNGVTTFNFLRATLCILLSKLSGQQDLTIGTPVAARNHLELENLVGVFVNTLPLRTTVHPAHTFLEWLGEITTHSFKAFAFQDYPFNKIIEALKLPRDTSRNPLFDVMMVLQNSSKELLPAQPGFTIRSLDQFLYPSGKIEEVPIASKCDLTVNFDFTPDNKFYIDIEYDTHLFKKTRIDLLYRSYISIIGQVLDNPARKISSIEIVDEEEKQKILYSYNAPIAAIEEYSISDLLQPSLLKQGNKTAIITGRTKTSYKQLHTRIHRVAAHLSRCMGEDDHCLTGILMDRSEWTVVTLLGVLNAGTAYLPVDTHFPPERIRYILQDAQPACMIVDDAGLLLLPNDYKGRVIHVNRLKQLRKRKENEISIQKDRREQVAYVIYTSGSTGQPKGVEICHRNAIAFLKWAATEFAGTDYRVLYATTSYCFDLSVFECFVPLMQGKTIRLLNSAIEIPDFIDADRKVLINTVPSAVRNLLHREMPWNNVAALNMAGEVVPDWFKKTLDHHAIEVRNLYGPTEDTTYSTVYRFKDDEHVAVPIGRPVGFTQLYIMDKEGNLVSTGVDGEIYVSGQSVAKGYLNRSALTAERFIDNPFVSGMKMYKTGDVGRWLPDGTVAYLGRTDDQVKIRGYRIEPGEIQHVLEQHSAVSQAVITVNTVDAEKQLVAYWAGDKTVTSSDLKAHLAQHLPGYMVPAYWCHLEEIPLNNNGKLDRSRLPDPVSTLLKKTGLVNPTNSIQQKLLALWQQVLAVPELGITDNFFDVGGHSLKAIRLRYLIAKHLCKEVTLHEIFTNPTIAEQAAIIEDRSIHLSTSIPVIKEQPYYPVTAAQKRLWILSRFEEANSAYNMPGVYVFEGYLDKAALEQSFNTLLNRHESFRTVFREDEQGEVKQYILTPEAARFAIVYHDLRQENEREKILNTLLSASVVEPFDLAAGSLIRATLYQVADDKWVCCYVMHHIVSDGWSMGVLIKELFACYEAYSKGEAPMLRNLAIQYKDFTVWQQERLSSEWAQSHKEYWLQQFKGELPVLELPYDNPRPAIKTYNGGIVKKNIDSSLVNALKVLTAEKGSTTFMGLLALVNALLYRYSHQEGLIMGIPIAGREHADLEDQIGFYVNTLALRTTCEGNKSFTSLLDHVKQVTLGAYAHQSFLFDELVDALELSPDRSRNALFDVMVIWQDPDIDLAWKEKPLGQMRISSYDEVALVTSKFDLTFTFEENNDTIQVAIEYNSDLFYAATVERLAGHLQQLLKGVVTDPLAPIDQLDFIDDVEKQLLLETFNDTTVDYAKDKTLIELFEVQVAKTPDAVALIFEEKEITYRTLNELSNQLGDYLRQEYAIKPDDLVGIRLERDEWLVIAMLGILKSGGGCLPVDPGNPTERIDYILKDSGCKAVIDNSELTRFKAVQNNFSTINLQVSGQPGNVAYVIYTSGSTGMPKGCMLENQGVINHLFSKTALLKLITGDAICHSSELHFVGGIWQLWAPLITGGKVVLCTKEELQDLEKLLFKTAAFNASVLEVIPSQLNEYLSYEKDVAFGAIKTLILTGEKLTPHFVNRCHAGNAGLEIINTYGQTECSDVTTCYHIPRNLQGKSVLIGSPIQNTQHYILSPAGALCAIGVIGEICTSGDGVSRGYLNNPTLTGEKFITHPFKKGKHLYKTGDLGKWLPNGTIEITGRKDEQVKIRGHRIETAEIEDALLQYQEIEKAVVMPDRRNESEKRLVAFITSRSKLDVARLRSHLTKLLPEYMVPALFIQVAAMPLLANAKIDKKALFTLAGTEMETGVEYVAPRNEVELKLAGIWKEILQKDSISIKDSFFALGGHSLKATRLCSQLYKVFEVKVGLKEVFAHPLLEEQAQLITQARKIKFAAITPAPVQPHYPLSPAQRRLWVLSQLEKASVAYNMPGVYVLEGTLQWEALEYAFAMLIERHEALRTTFNEDEQGNISQFIQLPQEAAFKIASQDVREEEDQEQIVTRLLHALCTHAFDLASGPLMRAGLYQVADTKWIFCCVMHHIICDGWSMDVLIREFFLYYNAFVKGTPGPLPALPIQYKDYVVWQQEQQKNGIVKEHKAWWLKQFEGALPVLGLPGDKPRPAVKEYNGGIIKRIIPADLCEKLKLLGAHYQSTLFMNLVAVVNALLYRYTGQEDLIVGSPIAGRHHADLEGQIGFYVNMLALRARFNGTESYSTLLQRLKKHIFEAYEHQEYPFDELVDELGLQRDLSRNALFDVSVALQNTTINMREIPQQVAGLTIRESGRNENAVSKFDLSFDFTETGETIQAVLIYNSDIYNRSTAEQLAGHLVQLLAAIVADPDKPLNELDFLSEKEKQRQLIEFNNTAVDYPINSTVVHLFREQVAKTPDNIAIEFENTTLTYKELDEQSDRLASYLRMQQGVQADDLVGIMLNRSDRLLVAILGILKAGGAYVPIDPVYPNARKAYMLQDAGIQVLITQTDYIFDLAFFNGVVFAIDVQLDAIEVPVQPLECINKPNDLAYVMYTSGSTGQPKGVMIEHSGIVRLVKAANYIHLTGEEVLLSTGAVSFDATTFEYWSMLLNGGRLVMCSAEVLLDQHRLAEEIQKRKVTTMWFTAGWLHQLIDADLNIFKGLKTIVAGGDKLSAAHIQALQVQYPEMTIINGYGPTENTTFSLACKIEYDPVNIPIGKPLTNSTVYIVNDRQQLLPMGAIGEICVGGAGLARGYLNNPALTEEKFVPDPFCAGKRMYKTGDLGRWLPDGMIEFAGRADDQVKISGYRIELGEIESALQSHAAIDAAVVTAKATKTADRELIAYLVCNQTLQLSGIRSHLSTLLPAYMMPHHFVELPALPLNANGKVDKAKLPEPEGTALATGREFIGARDATEEKLVKIWQEILDKENISVNDNFFELGGHSLKATRLASVIHKEFDVKIELKDLFSKVMLEEQAQHIKEAKKTSFIAITAAAPQASYLLSSSQRRLWALSQFEESNIAYNITAAFTLTGQLHYEALENAFARLLQRHESLRTVFKADEAGTIRQFIQPGEENWFQLASIDLRNESEKEEREKKLITAVFTTPFDLAAGPLLRAAVYQKKDNCYTLAFVMHHIISDGWSMGVLIKELLLFYNEQVQGGTVSLAPLQIHYKDYAVWQQEQFKNDRLAEHRKYWLQQFEGELPVLELPADKVRPAIKTYNGGTVSTHIDLKLMQQLQALMHEQECTLFMGLLALVNILLYRYTGQQDLIIGSPIAGREHIDMANQIGFYVNTLALRTRFKGENSYCELLQNIRQTTLAAYEHQAYPFDELVEDLDVPHNLGRGFLFDVMMVLQNAAADPVAMMKAMSGVRVEEYPGAAYHTSKYDLIFAFVETESGARIHIEYNRDIYHKETVERLATHLLQLLQVIIANPTVPIAELDFLSAIEKDRLLHEFNATAGDPDHHTIVELFEAQVERTPNATALIFEEKEYTYQELNEVANQLAGYLRKHYDIRPDDLVGVNLERSEWLIISILGILKSGGAYLPIDIAFPPERVKYMLEDARCKVNIDDRELAVFRQEQNRYEKKNVKTINKPNDLAYVMYTSGSTGKPKGVMVEHKSVSRLVKTPNYVSLTGTEILLSTGAVSFDATTFEYWGMLLNGGRLIICSRETLLNTFRLAEELHNRKVNTLWVTTGWLHQLIDTHIDVFKELQTVLTGGERLLDERMNRLQETYPHLTIIHCYGPTENTTYSTAWQVQLPVIKAPIGKPITNSSVFITDARGALVPIGAAGEICVGGDGLARGYLNQPELTKEKFVANPYKAGELMYRSGDIGRWLPDGNIEFIGRKDDQIKIRGYRIELGEIEAALQGHEMIDAAVVVIQTDDKGEKRLVAFVTGKEAISIPVVRTWLAAFVPVYMIPDHFAQLPALPLAPNGKTDKKSLPVISFSEPATVEYVAPRNETEEKLVLLWQEILGKQKIGIKDNFFELGGHSLKAAQLITKINATFLVRISIQSIFKEPTIEHIGGQIAFILHQEQRLKDKEHLIQIDI